MCSGSGMRLGQVAGRARSLPAFAIAWRRWDPLSDPPSDRGPSRSNGPILPSRAVTGFPEMIELAGGEAVLGCPGSPSVRVTWEQIGSCGPEVVVFMPCGYDLDAAVAEASAHLSDKPELRSARALFAVDASSYFSRPGPRLVEGVEILAHALHPDVVPECPPGTIRRIR